NSPGLLGSWWEAQALEWNRHPCHVALASDFAVRIPKRVEGSIEIAADFLARCFGPNRVPLHAQGIDLEHIGAAAVVKSVEHDLDRAVVRYIFAASFVSPYLARLIETHEHRIETLFVISEIRLGACADRRAIVSIAL